MRIRILHKPTSDYVDGIRLDRFKPGCVYEVGSAIGSLMLAEAWAEPVTDHTPALLEPLPETDFIIQKKQLKRPLAVAADRSHRRRRTNRPRFGR